MKAFIYIAMILQSFNVEKTAHNLCFGFIRPSG